LTKSRKAEMRVFKSVLATLAVMALIGGGFISCLLLAPVTASNVSCRLKSISAMGTLALRLNDAAAAEMQKLTKGSFGCLPGRLAGEAGPEIASRVTEAARKLGVLGIKQKWNSDKDCDGGGMLESSGLKDKIMQEFSEFYVKAANACQTADG
jgi:hypothetical protein